MDHKELTHKAVALAISAGFECKGKYQGPNGELFLIPGFAALPVAGLKKYIKGFSFTGPQDEVFLNNFLFIVCLQSGIPEREINRLLSVSVEHSFERVREAVLKSLVIKKRKMNVVEQRDAINTIGQVFCDNLALGRPACLDNEIIAKYLAENNDRFMELRTQFINTFEPKTATERKKNKKENASEENKTMATTKKSIKKNAVDQTTQNEQQNKAIKIAPKQQVVSGGNPQVAINIFTSNTQQQATKPKVEQQNNNIKNVQQATKQNSTKNSKFRSNVKVIDGKKEIIKSRVKKELENKM